MAQMNRNVNLEEIDSDALFGIDALKNQTILQKIVFFGSVIAGVLLNVLLLFDMFIKQSLCNKNRGKVYMVCDELKLLPHLLHLEVALNFGRSIGVNIIAGIQSMEQLYEVYGDIGGKNIASGFQTTICFHTNNQATREYISGIHGTNYIAIQHTGASNNLQESIRDGYAVEDWEMVNLCQGEAIVGLPFENPIKFKFERYR